MRNRTLNVMPLKALIKVDRGGKALDKGIGGLLKTAAPKAIAGGFLFAIIVGLICTHSR